MNLHHIENFELLLLQFVLLTDQQKYLTSQCKDLLNKKSRIEFELDQVQASLNVFQQALIDTTKETAEEILEEGEK